MPVGEFWGATFLFFLLEYEGRFDDAWNGSNMYNIYLRKSTSLLRAEIGSHWILSASINKLWVIPSTDLLIVEWIWPLYEHQRKSEYGGIGSTIQ